MWKPEFMRHKFGRSFWSVIVSEIFERGAWYGFFAVAPFFLCGSPEEGALGLTHAEKGFVLGTVPAILYLFPLIAGTIGDRIGYKKVLLASFAILSVAYYLLSLASDLQSLFWLFLFVALGAGAFKPMVTATVAEATKGKDKRKSLAGFGLFYMVVNLGGFIGPIISGLVRPAIDENDVMHGSWEAVFYLSSAYMAAMFFWTLFFYKEPERKRGDGLIKKLTQMITDLKDWRLLILLFILTAFWGAFTQFFYNMPTWIAEWVDTSTLASLPFMEPWVNHGQLKPEMIINLNAFTIIFLSVYVSGKLEKITLLKAINIGILVLSLAVLAFFFSSFQVSAEAGWVLLIAAIFTFTIGELMASPRVNELMGKIAPEGKSGAYQGYGFLSTAGGFLIGGWLSALYGTFADKTGMYRTELIENFSVDPASIKETALYDLGVMLQNNGVDLNSLDQRLWETHQPYMLWVVCAAVGIGGFILLMLYRKFIPRIEKEEGQGEGV